MAKIYISAFYRFFPVPTSEIEHLAAKLEELGNQLGLRGLLIFAEEGLNGTACALAQENLDKFLVEAARLLKCEPFEQNLSDAILWPYRKFDVRLRDEIVTLGKPEVQPLARNSPTHLSPADWDKAMSSEDVVVLDTRNWYETKVGKFKNALDPKIEEFSEFSGFLEQSKIEKTKKILIYCTGGIRCEKAIVEMSNHGFQNVFQLDGGILNYLKQRPNQNFEGECFVFDTRVAVDQNLKPTKNYKFCPHCGQPAEEKIECARCDTPAMICIQCLPLPEGKTCSKNCAHHFARAPGLKGRKQGTGIRFESREIK